MSLKPKWIVVPLWLLAILACQPEDATDARRALLEGMDVVEVGAASHAPILPWYLTETPSLRVGGTGRGEYHQFVEISAATMLTDGGVLVADARSGLVRRFGPEGGFRGQLGTPGEGPSEFRSPRSLLVAPEDSIWIWDADLWRMSVFSPRGEYVRSERYDPTATELYPVRGMWPEVIRLGGDRSRLIRLIGKSATKAPSAGELDLVGLAVHRYGASKVELIATLPREEQVEVEAPWGTATLTPPLTAGPRIALGRDDMRACVGHQGASELLCIDSTGARVGVRWTSQPRPVDPEDPAIARWREQTGESYSAKLAEQDVQAMLSAVPIPRVYPAFRDLLFDALGYLWVCLGPSPQRGGGNDYLVFGPNLRPMGRFTLPKMTVIEVGTDYILGIRRDAFGVDELVAFSLSR